MTKFTKELLNYIDKDEEDIRPEDIFEDKNSTPRISPIVLQQILYRDRTSHDKIFTHYIMEGRYDL